MSVSCRAELIGFLALIINVLRKIYNLIWSFHRQVLGICPSWLHTKVPGNKLFLGEKGSLGTISQGKLRSNDQLYLMYKKIIDARE
jgi:hypothetical protein